MNCDSGSCKKPEVECTKKDNECSSNDDCCDDLNCNSDICYPYNYDGIDNYGRIMCSETKVVNGHEIKISTDINNLNSKEQLFGHY